MAAQTVTFFSKYTGLNLVRQPAVDKPLPSGTGWVHESKGVRYQFMPALDDESGHLIGRLDVRVGQDKLQDSSGWLHADADPEKVRDAVEALRSHREFGRDFWQADVPAKDVRARIRKASVNLRDNDLVALLEEERSNNGRAEIIAEIQDALNLVLEQRASLEAEIEAEAAKAKPKPKAPPGA